MSGPGMLLCTWTVEDVGGDSDCDCSSASVTGLSC